jgi:Domain of unknown function (DUF4124)
MSQFTHTLRTGCALLLVMLAGTAAAEQIYRSVDAEGNVTFSNQPPANSVTVDQVSVPPGPSDAAQREALERMQRQEAAANEMSEARARSVQQKPQPSPPVPEPVEQQEPVNQYYGYPYGNTPRRDQIRDRLPERPVQLPSRPVQRPVRPVPR